MTPSISVTPPAIQFATSTEGSFGSAPTAYPNSFTACSQNNTLIGQVLYQSPAAGTDPAGGAQLYTNTSLTTAWNPGIGSPSFFKIGRASTYWAVYVSTGGVIQAVTDCSTVPSVSITPSVTPTVTPSFTPTPSISITPSVSITQTPSVSVSLTPPNSISVSQAAVSFALDTTGYSTAFDSCANGSQNPIGSAWMAPGTTTPTVSQFVYTNSSLTTAYNGGSNYHNMRKGATLWAVQIGATGQITAVTDCSTVPSVTPTISITPSVTVTPSSVVVTNRVGTGTPSGNCTTFGSVWSVAIPGNFCSAGSGATFAANGSVGSLFTTYGANATVSIVDNTNGNWRQVRTGANIGAAVTYISVGCNSC